MCAPLCGRAFIDISNSTGHTISAGLCSGIRRCAKLPPFAAEALCRTQEQKQQPLPAVVEKPVIQLQSLARADCATATGPLPSSSSNTGSKKHLPAQEASGPPEVTHLWSQPASEQVRLG